MRETVDEEKPPPIAPLAVPRARGRALLGRDWDAIVVGAGPGGLASAVLLATRGRLRVLVLERHYEPGGLTQTFRRRRDEFEVGVHYVGEVGRRANSLRRVFDALTEKRLAWSSFGPVHDRVRFEGREIPFGPEIDETRETLVQFAPSEAVAIDRYLADVRACAREAPSFLLSRAEPLTKESARTPFRRFVDATTSEHLAQIGASPRLAALLTYCFGNYGTPPDRSSFAAHAIAVGYYLEGAYYPVGGGSRIAHEMIATLVARGGAVMVCAEVSAIRVEDGRVRGVRLADGREIDAPIVISDAGLATTSATLLDENQPGVGEMREAARAIGPSLAHCALYLGLDGDPEAIGLPRSNLWHVGTRPVVSEAAMTEWACGEVAVPATFFVSCASRNDPSWASRRPGRSSVVALFNVPWEPFAAWRDDQRGRRGEGYATMKGRLTREALDAVSAAVPAIVGRIDHVEMSTPVTTRTFTSHPRGETAGLDHSPLRFRLAASPQTRIEGLALAGQDAWLAGVGGAVFGGVSAASWVLRRNLARELLFGS